MKAGDRVRASERSLISTHKLLKYALTGTLTSVRTDGTAWVKWDESLAHGSYRSQVPQDSIELIA